MTFSKESQYLQLLGKLSMATSQRRWDEAVELINKIKEAEKHPLVQESINRWGKVMKDAEVAVKTRKRK